MTEQEQWGLALFNDPDKGNCAACHPSEPEAGEPPLFTDFTFDNVGVPRNPDNPFYDMDEVYFDDGTPINPLGSAWIDKGLGGFLETRPEWADMAAENMGKHKVPTLRNVDKRPGNNTPKAYMHNGVFKSLEEVVHFYNTRDVEDWPAPEVPENVNTDELGNLGLTEEEEAAIVAFLRTLSDGYNPAMEINEDRDLDKDKDDKEVEPADLKDFIIEWDEPLAIDEETTGDIEERTTIEEDLAFALFEGALIIDELGPEDFKNEESALELKIELEAVFSLLEENMHAESLMLLEADILKHIDGCFYDGQPDRNDWITSYKGQILVYPIFSEATELLANLIQ